MIATYLYGDASVYSNRKKKECKIFKKSLRLRFLNKASCSIEIKRLSIFIMAYSPKIVLCTKNTTEYSNVL